MKLEYAIKALTTLLAVTIMLALLLWAASVRKRAKDIEARAKAIENTRKIEPADVYERLDKFEAKWDKRWTEHSAELHLLREQLK